MRARKVIAILSTCLLLLQMIYFPIGITAATNIPLSASGAILMEKDSGRVLFEKNAHEIHRIASITKIMTAILAIESGKMNDVVTIKKEAVYAEGSSVYLQIGEKIKLEDLVYGLMLRSGNDAANAIADYVGGSIEGFVFLMNQKAEELGMTNTKFANPHGLDNKENHYSTAYDMALLTKYAMNNKKYQKISGTKVYKFKREKGPQSWINKNRLLTEKYKYCTGGKTGYTKRAGRTLVTTAEKNATELIAVTLDASDDWNDHITMYERAFNEYPVKTLVEKGNLSIEAKGIKNKELFVKNSIRYPLSNDEISDVRIEYKLQDPNILAKTNRGRVGTAIFHFQEKPLEKVPIYIRQIHQKHEESWWEKIKNLLFSQMGVIFYD
ncbi:serine hydrolase [Lederbergia wuyishanensis]|uniref:D-alanyl-D-alanine carboxypeptidase n=1 Tax=Lederbergia wuyishanensis TaxID=1347903 RepID=A0ABU0D140_9BACI|nr:D-alanyl-D-alanine carboxypeptidase family protein [Lederbergia wuyishanensis]MCJ8006720.1 D-alanyl-D-alanine carboxypeptidase [Lederbergia wuyishanensis]MDQ0342102.1 D-alanyl-D-alanine carboxypeptidase [Lederbergia wuyishanensis]